MENVNETDLCLEKEERRGERDGERQIDTKRETRGQHGRSIKIMA
jgi:hypothetical protein